MSFLVVVVILVAVVIGYGVGTFAFSNIALPFFWAWPKARRLGRQGRLTKPIPMATFVVAPLVWSVLVLGSLALVSGLFSVQVATAYLLGLLASLGKVVPLVARPNEHMEADFADTWRAYLK